MLAAQTRMELRLSLRNGEQVLLTLLIPLLLTAVLVAEPFIQVDERSAGRLRGARACSRSRSPRPRSPALAIGTGFERKYGVLKRLGATALPRSVLLLGKTGAVLCVEVLQVLLIGGLGLALGWRPTGGAGAVLSTALLVVAGTAAFAGLGLLLAGTLRAEATLAAANLAWFLLLFFGGVLFPLSKFPAGLAERAAVPADRGALRRVPQRAAGRRRAAGAVPAHPRSGGPFVALGAAAATFKWE